MDSLPPPKPSTTGKAKCEKCGYEYQIAMWDLLMPCPECGYDPLMNPNSFNPYNYTKYEWNGTDMVEREINHLDIKRKIEASRQPTIFKPIHIPIEKTEVV